MIEVRQMLDYQANVANDIKIDDVDIYHADYKDRGMVNP